MATKKQETFEEKMNRLEEIANKLDSGDLSLDENLKLYLEGQEIIKELEGTLQEAKKKIEEKTKSE